MKPKLSAVLNCKIKRGASIAAVFLLFLPGVVSAQKSNFLSVKTGWEHIGSRDRGMSPLLYSGSGFYVGLEWDQSTTTHATEVALNLATGVQRNKYEAPITYNRGNLQIATYYSRKKSDKGVLNWGWLINNVFSHRLNKSFVNFNDHYEYFSNIGPAVRYAIPFVLKGREIQITGSGYLQLLGIMIRPSYTSSFPGGFLRDQSSVAKNLVHSVQLLHPLNNFNFGLSPGLVYPLKSGNKLSLVYDYQFYRLNSSNPVTQSGGVWYISLSTRL